jgi:hypothetical protein
MLIDVGARPTSEKRTDEDAARRHGNVQLVAMDRPQSPARLGDCTSESRARFGQRATGRCLGKSRVDLPHNVIRQRWERAAGEAGSLPGQHIEPIGDVVRHRDDRSRVCTTSHACVFFGAAGQQRIEPIGCAIEITAQLDFGIHAPDGI